MKNVMILLLGLLATACSVQVGEYVGGVKKDPRAVVPTPTQPTAGGMMTYRVVPGKLNSATTNSGAIQGFVTTTNRFAIMGGDRSMTLTISRSKLTQ